MLSHYEALTAAMIEDVADGCVFSRFGVQVVRFCIVRECTDVCICDQIIVCAGLKAWLSWDHSACSG